MAEGQNLKKVNGLFLVWKKYQRRPEVLAPLMNCELRFTAHLFQSKYLRPLDYLLKLVANLAEIIDKKPDFIVAQCPPPFSALPAFITKTPYIIDGHNPLFQLKFWQQLPLAQTLLNHAAAIIVHNAEMFELVKGLYPQARLFTIADPIQAIAPTDPAPRIKDQILVIPSFDPWDEPVGLLLETMAQLQAYKFVITADINKLPPAIATQLKALSNVELTGFLATEEYHRVLCSSLGALVLTTSEATQPSGACEALSSNTPLVISRTALIEQLFGDWAVVVDNSAEAIAEGIRSLSLQELDLTPHREQWNAAVHQEVARLLTIIAPS